MDGLYHHAAADPQQPRGYTGGYLEPYAAGRLPPGAAAHEPAQPDHAASHWAPARGYEGHPYGFRCDFPAPSHGGAGFGGPPPFGFDPSVPPPPFGCPPGRFPSAAAAAPQYPFNTSTFDPFSPQFRPGPQTARYDSDPGQNQQREYEDFSGRGGALLGRADRDRGPGAATRPEDETALQRRKDLQWIRRFLQGRDKTPAAPQTQQQPPPSSSAPDPRAALYRAAELVSRLAESCEALGNSVEDQGVWADSYRMALNVKTELQGELDTLGDGARVARWRAKLARVAKRRARRLRARKELLVEEQLRQDRIAEKEAAINTWRLQQVQRVQEKKKEQELKLAADAVLCEVRKKQADVKRMQDILKSLEKLRRLRKEAAARKGIDTEQQCDEAFSSRLERLRCVMKKRTAVYSAEEKALMVMLEGEQEEERRREQEKRMKKERERHLQRKRRATAMLFGEDLPAGSPLQPFREFYTQAERSLHAMLQIRSGWDTFVVPGDHPDGSAVPEGWILPDAPSDPSWSSALLSADGE
ncbi:programmed cell death protein 7 isoform X2 [Clinocottus analis]|uniref:programmed cell death protein 7 isoform X2 n=1 Tax=Clinocottus analis TaxID=304258 RepID=UPI0035BFAC44